MKELTREEMLQQLQNPGVAAVYFHTPLCGTCRLARRMLEVAEAALSGPELLACDLNFVPDLAERFCIEAVPCLARLEDGTATEKVYAMQSADGLYRRLLSWGKFAN